MEQAPPRSSKTLLWVLLGIGGLCAVCGAGTVALVGLGVIAGATDSMGAGAPAVGQERQEGAPGGFTFSVPPSFSPVSEGRWRFEKLDGNKRHTVDLIRLPAVPGLEDPITKLTQQWNATIVRDWPNAPTRVLPLRRFVNNGARAYFSSASLTAANADHPARVSLYLVEAGDRLEPFVVLQEYFDTSVGAAIVAQYSFDQTQPAVEEVFKGIEGSPIGPPLVEEAEVVGAWSSSSGASLQYVNVITGGTTVNSVASNTKYAFSGDHTFSYDYGGANTRFGNTQFASQQDTGTWRLEHDLLLLDGEQFDRKFFIVGAGEGPAGKRVLYVIPEGNWSLSPGAIGQHGQLFEGE